MTCGSGDGGQLDPSSTQRASNRMHDGYKAESSGSLRNPTKAGYTACENIGCYYCDLFGPDMDALAEELGLSTQPEAKRARDMYPYRAPIGSFGSQCGQSEVRERSC